MAFDAGGAYAYASELDGRRLYRFGIDGTGCLTKATVVSYEGYLDEGPRLPPGYWSPAFYGLETTAVPGGGCVMVSDPRWGGVYKFDTAGKDEIISDGCYWLEGRKWLSEKTARQRAEAAAVQTSGKPALSGSGEVIRAYGRLTSSLTSNLMLACGPDGYIYSVTTQSIVRFRIQSDGSLGACEVAYALPSGWDDYLRKAAGNRKAVGNELVRLLITRQ